MPWKCPKCGTPDLSDDISVCHVCGYQRVPVAVILESESSGKTLEIRLPDTFGQGALKRLGDPDIRFVSSDQFKIEKDLDKARWCVKPIAWAVNPTFLNGEALSGEGSPLAEGDKLSIKGQFFRLNVHLKY